MAYPLLDSFPLRINDTWWYDFSKLFLEGKFLGVDFYFTYGPLAQYLGPLVQAGQKAGWPGVLFKLSIAAAYLSNMADIASSIQADPPLRRFPFYSSTLVLFSLYPFIHPQVEAVYAILIVLTPLCFFLQFQSDARRNKNFYLLGFLAVTLLQFKFSIGIQALAVFAILSLFLLLHKRPLGWIALVWLAGFSGCFLLFNLLTGSWAFLDFWRVTWGIAAAYSETHAFHLLGGAGSGKIYPMGFFTLACFWGLGALFAKNYLPRGNAGPAFVVTLFISGFYLYKHGFVRADGHTGEFYLTLFPLLFLLASLCWVRASFKSRDFWVAAICLFLFFQAWHLNLMMFNEPGFSSQLKGSIEDNWLEKPPALLSFWSHPLDRGRDMAESEKTWLSSQLPDLYKTLNQISDGKAAAKKTIVFSPWTNIEAAAVPQYELIPTSSLEIYLAAAQPGLNRMDQRLFSSPGRPDLVVISPPVLDGRNSLSEYSGWLESLLKYYEPLGDPDGQTVLAARINPSSLSIRTTAKGPGLFFYLQAPALDRVHQILFSAVKWLFKPPEIQVRLVMEDGKGAEKVVTAKGFYSQLREGVYFGDAPVGQLLRGCSHSSSAVSPLWTVKSATAVRYPGLHNLPVFPEAMPLMVRYCNLSRTASP